MLLKLRPTAERMASGAEIARLYHGKVEIGGGGAAGQGNIRPMLLAGEFRIARRR